MAGVYFAFSTFIMTALERIGHERGIATMNSINVSILRSLFMPLFLGTTLASAILASIGFTRLNAPGATPMVMGGIIYVVGMFVCTMLLNVPLNNALAAVDPASEAASAAWTRYRKEWTFWNHVRTLASCIAGALFILSIHTSQTT
jgi:uncharacterized membrane protein